MFSKTMIALESFDNQHDFERICADILNSLGYKDVELVAPRGGEDGGIDIKFKTEDNGKGLAWVTLRKDIDTKFKEDFKKRNAGEFDKIILFCTSHLTHKQKLFFAKQCIDILQAEFEAKDVETLRSLLDTSLKSIREMYLHINNPEQLVVIDQQLLDELNQLKRRAGLITEQLCGHGAIDSIEQGIITQLSQVNEMSGTLLEYTEVVQPIRDFANSGWWFLKRRKDHDWSQDERENLVKELTENHKALIEACNKFINKK